jgi:LDH2 family malate/lactate/ureidoglycolate dehydrogenase
LDGIEKQVDTMLSLLKGLSSTNGHDQVFVAGEKEFFAEKKFEKEVVLQKKVFETLEDIGSKIGLSLRHG